MPKPDYDRAANMAYRALLSLSITELPVRPLDILRLCKNTMVHTYDEIMPKFDMTDRWLFKLWYMENQDAVTVRRIFGDGTVRYELFYDSHAHPLRMRFTLSHELGHILLNHRDEADWEEKEADYFASQLLAPQSLFLPLNISGYDMSAEGISSLFGISKAAAAVSLSGPKHRRDTETDSKVMKLFSLFIYNNSPSDEVTAHEAS